MMFIAVKIPLSSCVTIASIFVLTSKFRPLLLTVRAPETSFYRGVWYIAKFTIYREKLRNLMFSAINRENLN